MYRSSRIVAAVAGVGLVTILFRAVLPVNPTTVGFAYLVTILLIAAEFGLTEAVTASLAATFCFNFFFLPPVGTLTIADPQNWIALGAFLITSLVASQLSEVARRRNGQLLQRQLELERLYALSRGIMLLDPVQPAAAQIATEIPRIYETPEVAIYDR